MSTLSSKLRILTIAAVAALGMLASRSADACTNDVDCPEPACGGQVCVWIAQTCQPAGTAVSPSTDGWCTVDTDCKCNGMGAKCQGNICTFTKPPKAGGTGGASATGGASGTGTGGKTGSGGSAAAADAGTTPSKDSGGCTLTGTSPSSWLGAVVGLAGLVALRRRRNRV